MALRNQPYIPLYVQDFMTDEKLMECSASATGIYIRIMCLMHKQDEYGVILLKQKYKQSDKQIINFALQLDKFLPYPENEIEDALSELIHEKVLILEGDKIKQKRMIKDNAISLLRSKAGKKGGERTQFAKAKVEAKHQANTENESENENESEIEDVTKTKYEECVFLKDQEYRNLVEKYGEYNANRCIKKLNDYKLSSGKTYKSDYHAIYSWVIDRLKIQPEKSGRLVV